jgi:trans-aconitate methyltransferase
MSKLKEALLNKPAPRWKLRMKHIQRGFEEIRFPNFDPDSKISQDQEWCEVRINGDTRRIRFHDYDDVYRIAGLYESLFYQRLKCCSPSRVVRLLEEVVEDHDVAFSDLKVLDVGAGNGVVGDELHSRKVESLVGVDIIPEAMAAARRDRPGIYDGYFVADLTDLSESDEKQLRKVRFNCLTTVAALGFGDIPDAAFVKALDLIDTPGWLAFNIKQDFLEDQDQTGFCRLIQQLCNEHIIRIEAFRRYRHRISTTGEPLYYVAMIARKRRDVPDELLASGEDEEAVVEAE